jgi:hypothetical protein
MGYRIELDRERRLARVMLFGSTSVEEQVCWIRELVANPDWLPEYNLLVDARGLVEQPLHYKDATVVAHVARELDNRHAYVGDTELLYGCCRMAERIRYPCSCETAAFRTIAEAERWLGTAHRPGEHAPIGSAAASG